MCGVVVVPIGEEELAFALTWLELTGVGGVGLGKGLADAEVC